MEIKHRKLGREKAWGQAIDEGSLIELDPRLLGKKHLEVLIHEIMHLQNPDWSETRVLKKAKEMSKLLWAQKYRRIDDNEKQPK